MTPSLAAPRERPHGEDPAQRRAAARSARCSAPALDARRPRARRLRGRRRGDGRLHRARRRRRRTSCAALEAGVPVRRRHERLGARRRSTARRASAGLPVFYAPNFALGAVLMMRFAARGVAPLRGRRDRRAPPRDEARRAVGHRPGDRRARWAATYRSTRCACPGLVAHQEVLFGGLGRDADDPPRHDSRARRSCPASCSRSSDCATLPPGLTVGLDAAARAARSAGRRAVRAASRMAGVLGSES